MPKTRGERREDKRNKNKEMKVSGRSLNQTQQKIVEKSHKSTICNRRWTSKDNHGTGHVCAGKPSHGDNHQCSVCGDQRR